MRRWLHRSLAIVLGCLPIAAPAMKLVHSERSLYRQVLVYEDGGQRCLCFTRDCTIGRQGCMDLARPRRLVFDYTQMMMAALFLAPRPADILVVGLGGGTLPGALATLLPGSSIDVVEIDPAVVRVARRYFGFTPAPTTRIHEEDGRAYVRRALRAGTRYDLIMLDAYDHEYIPEHLLTQEFLREVRSLLRPGGVLAANTFSSSRLYHNESVTYRSVFGDFYNLKGANRVILACNGELPPLPAIRQHSQAFEHAYSALGFSAHQMLQRFSTVPDWNPAARVLTDQYSPANLLNSLR
ncbi:MAG: fused MFS/spermidine synthase [Gammaproteobacteria bacterium]|nr:fused MFS/spermidine synthase [Gammaproteobacteria bacterium]